MRLDVADIDHQHDSGLSALANTAMRDHPDVLRELLKHGARVDIRCNDGKTPYLIAVQEGHAMCASILLASGADPCATDHDGHSASDLAPVKEHAVDPLPAPPSQAFGVRRCVPDQRADSIVWVG